MRESYSDRAASGAPTGTAGSEPVSPHALTRELLAQLLPGVDAELLLAGLLAGYGQATNSTREFQQELSGYGRYYWHSFVDEAVGNYFTEAIMPLATHEDPRYYTLGHTHGTVLHRTAYAVSRLAITRTDSGSETFNFSEIVGNALGTGVSNAYYPRQERTWGSNADKWAVQIGIDGIADILKEFWPDIRRDLFRKKQ